MLSGVSMYALARRTAAMALSLWLIGCDEPQAATPGLEPPSRRDGGPAAAPGSGMSPDDGPGSAADGGLNMPGASGGSSGSASGSGAMMQPPVVTPGDESDAGSEQ